MQNSTSNPTQFSDPYVAACHNKTIISEILSLKHSHKFQSVKNWVDRQFKKKFLKNYFIYQVFLDKYPYFML